MDNRKPINVLRVPPAPERPRRGRFLLVGLLVFVALVQVMFPGRCTLIAATVGTGIGRGVLQQRIDALEDKAIRGEALTDDDRAFLPDFYSTLATGAILTVVVRQTGFMMRHYLEGSGEPFELEPRIFNGNRKVLKQAKALRRRITPDVCEAGETLTSPRFYMPDKSQMDSVFGLYHGTLSVTPRAVPGGGCMLRWRAEVPWVWPSYASLKKKYGRAHAESFPLPNMMSLLGGQRYALYVDNGLGHHLEVVGLATSFVAFGEWEEPL